MFVIFLDPTIIHILSVNVLTAHVPSLHPVQASIWDIVAGIKESKSIVGEVEA